MVPTPTPAPPIPMQAMPAPIIFAAWGSMRELLFRVGEWASMARVDRFTEVNASEDGKYVGLQDGYEQFERSERDREAERNDRAEPAEKAKRPQHRHETTKYLEGDVAGEHVGEQPHAVRDGARKKRQHLDERHQGQDVDRNAARHPQLEEMQTVLPESVKHDREKNEKGKRNRDDDMTRDCERVGNDADHIEYENEHEEREHQREELHAFRPGRVSQCGGDELVGHFGDRLQPPGHERPRTGGAEHQ